MVAFIVTFIKRWLEQKPGAVQNVTVMFIMAEADEWIAYVGESPAINCPGRSTAKALDCLLKELKHYSFCAGTTSQVVQYRYLKTLLLSYIN